MRRESKYNYLYKTTCSLTGRFYYGMHSTDKLDDRYLGSGRELSRSIKKYGKENHYKEIIVFYPTRKELKEGEKLLITEEVRQNPKCMNLALGGGGSNFATGLIPVKDKDNNKFLVLKNDPRYLSGELVHNLKDFIVVKDKEGNIFSISKDDPRYLSGELVHMFKNNIIVRDKEGNTFSISKDDPRYLSGELIPNAKNKVTVKDKEGNYLQINKNDPRYLSGELVGTFKGKNHTKETKYKFSLAKKGKYT